MSIGAHSLSGLVCLWLCLAAAAAPPPPPAYAGDAQRADSLLRTGKPEDALAPILAAHAAGMPEDSLYWMLSEAAWRKGAIDTAMGFNLAIRTPAAGPFRDSVLSQRYRLYVAAGLSRDAGALRDSLPRRPTAENRRPLRVTARMGSGWFGEQNDSAHIGPFGLGIADTAFRGYEHRIHAGLEAPLGRGGEVSWTAGLELQGVKSYAKDSLDSRLGATLREEGWLLPGLSLGAGAGGGQVTGSGWVGSCKGEAAWISLSGEGFTMLSAGLESEWDEEGRDRFQVAWLAWYRDATLRSGRGFSVSASLSGFRSDPIRDQSPFRVFYVDDVRAAAPKHFSDPAYSQAITPSSPRLAFQAYTQDHGSTAPTSRAPQSFLAFSPQATYALPLPGRLTSELTMALSGSWYPEPYLRDFAALPAGAPADLPIRPARDTVFGFARNQADGREYAAFLNQVSGGYEEHYADTPLRRERRTRLEGQGSAQVTLRRPFGGWGSLSLSALAKRYLSNLGDATPIWIPEWDAGVSLQWNGVWQW
jgi:hypothetical protein